MCLGSPVPWGYKKERIEVMAVTVCILPLYLEAREELTFIGEPIMCKVLWLTLSICDLILS